MNTIRSEPLRNCVEPWSRFGGFTSLRFRDAAIPAILISKRHGGGGDAPDFTRLGASS